MIFRLKSRTLPLGPRFFGLDDLSFFLNAATVDNDCEIIVITQQFSILRKLLFLPFPLPCKFHLFTRASSSAPDELKFMEIINSLPTHCFSKILSFTFLSVFNVRLINQKRLPYTKQFDLFLSLPGSYL